MKSDNARADSENDKSLFWGKSIDKELDMPLAFYFHLSGRKQNDQIRFGALFVTFPKSKVILYTTLFIY